MGAWSSYYQLGSGTRGTTVPTSPDTAVMEAYAVLGIKTELSYTGNAVSGLNLKTYYFGIGAEHSTKRFQKQASLQVDGVVGPHTAKALFLPRSSWVEVHNGIPNQLLSRIISLESGWDPGAIGSLDPLDHGLLQINLHFHPDVSEAQAATPSFSIPWGGKQLAAAYGSFGDWDATVASWNVGYVAARNWLNAGKPADGSTAATYVKLVKAQQV